MYIEGRLQTSKYEKDGIERYSTDIIGESFNFISGSGSSSSNNANQLANDMNQDTSSSNKQEKPNTDDFDDDIPF